MKQNQIVIRGIAQEAVRRLKMKCAGEQVTIKGWFLEVLRAELSLPLEFNMEESDGNEQGRPKVPRGANMPRVSGVGVQDVAGARGPSSESQSESGAVGGGVQKDRGGKGKGQGKGMTAEQFMALSNSDKMRAKREGKF